MKSSPPSLLIRFGPAFLVLAVGLCLWQAITVISKVPAYVFPRPTEVLAAFSAYSETILAAFAITAGEAVGGYLLAAFLGIVLGLAFAQVGWLRACFYPYAILLQTVPIVAVSPLIIMWFGSGQHSVMLITLIVCIFPILANTTQGLLGVDRNLIQLFEVFGAPRSVQFIKLRLPGALPSIFTGLRISAGISVIGAITGELFAGSSTVGQGGLGYSITFASSQLQMPLVFALVMVSTALGFAVFFGVVISEWYFLHKWHSSALAEES